MRILVCGGRDYADRDHIHSELSRIDGERGPITVIIHGGATGADKEGMTWAQENGRQHAAFGTDWRRRGRGAGPLRNQRMIDEGKPDFVVAFPGGKGTADMVRRVRAAKIEVIEIKARKIKP